MRRRVSFRTVLLLVLGVGLLGFVCAAGLALPSVWWDAVVGSLGAAAVLAVVLDPLLAPALTGAHHAVGRAVSLHPDQAQ